MRGRCVVIAGLLIAIAALVVTGGASPVGAGETTRRVLTPEIAEPSTCA